MNSLIELSLSVTLLIVLFFISRISIRKIFHLFHNYVGNDSVVYILISALLLPGTIIHELSHAFMAMILHLKIRDIHIFPEWKNGHIKLGSVLYEKKDVFRSILVGVAPFFVGMLSLWWLYSLGLYQTSSIIQYIGVSYIVFVISTTMFSSKQDLVDILYIVPVFILIVGFVYVFQIDMKPIVRLFEVEPVLRFMYAIRTYVSIAIGIQGFLYVSSVLLLSLKKNE